MAPKYEIAAQLIDAAGSLDEEAVDALLAEYPHAIASRYLWGQTALHFLVLEGPVESVHLLLDRGAEVNAQDEFGDTPLLSACMLNRVPMADLLLAHGADPGIPNGLQDYPLQVSLERGNLHLVQRLLEKGASTDIRSDISEGETIFCFLPEEPRARVEAAELLLLYGADPNARSALIDYPIIEAIRRGETALVQTYLRHGARLDMRAREGQGALALAAASCGNGSAMHRLPMEFMGKQDR